MEKSRGFIIIPYESEGKFSSFIAQNRLLSSKLIFIRFLYWGFILVLRIEPGASLHAKHMLHY